MYEQFMFLLKETTISEDECARLIGVSIPSIRRWKDGVTTPHPVMQALTMRILRTC